MVLLDTNVVIQFFKQDAAITAGLHGIGFANLVVSDVVVAELYQGALDKQELARIGRGLSGLPSLPITQDISVLMVQLLLAYALSYRWKFPDALIAATALHHGIPLYTLNLKDFRHIAGLALHEPV